MLTRRPLLALRAKVADIVDAFLTKGAQRGRAPRVVRAGVRCVTGARCAADENSAPDDVMASYTHVQHAQPVSIAFWLQHYAATFLRDLRRLEVRAWSQFGGPTTQ